MRYDCPPALVCWLLESVVPTRYREAMLGDLIEEYNLRVKTSSPTHCVSLVLESSLSINPVHSLVLVAQPEIGSSA